MVLARACDRILRLENGRLVGVSTRPSDMTGTDTNGHERHVSP
jgi:hypothetical protein